jgi:nucleoside-diphosphate-sugar epimerase
MRVLVIGGTGSIGSYLVPRLVIAGYEVSVIARHAQPRHTDPRLAWPAVNWILADKKAEEASGEWTKRLAAMETDVVIDLLCYRMEQAEMIVKALAGRVSHLLHCGSIWAYGPPGRVPYRESDERHPSGQYSERKAAIEAYLLREHRERSLPVTIIHPGHVSGRRWLPVDPQGTRNGTAVYQKLATGQPITLPNQGVSTLAHVHGDDVGQVFQLAIEHRTAAVGESFSATAPYALMLKACAETVARYFGQTANLEYRPLEEMDHVVDAEAYRIMCENVRYSPCCSIEKAQRVLGYSPRYTTEQIYGECLEYLLETGQLQV